MTGVCELGAVSREFSLILHLISSEEKGRVPGQPTKRCPSQEKGQPLSKRSQL